MAAGPRLLPKITKTTPGDRVFWYPLALTMPLAVTVGAPAPVTLRTTDIVCAGVADPARVRAMAPLYVPDPSPAVAMETVSVAGVDPLGGVTVSQRSEERRV